MSDHVYKHIELTGSSTIGIQEAIENAIGKAAKTVHEMRWFEMTGVRGHIEDNRIAHWQVTVKVGFRIED